ncbi:Histone-lysine N-methyltransferase, H3 lysine-79 specific [Cercospora zeina]
MAPIRLTRNRTRKQQILTSNNENLNTANPPHNNALQQLRALLHNGRVHPPDPLPRATRTATYQNDLMGRKSQHPRAPPPLLPGLHHSADNHEPTSNSNSTILLRYPFSGYTERFTFTKRIQKLTNRHHARPLDPIEDSILTIQSFHTQAGTLTSKELRIMREMLYRKYEEGCMKGKDEGEFGGGLQGLVDGFTNPALFFPPSQRSSFPSPLTEESSSHLLHQLHDRVISDSANLLSRPAKSSFTSSSSSSTTSTSSPVPPSSASASTSSSSAFALESTYGELLPSFLQTLFLQTHLTAKSTYLDLGSGVGQTCLLAALATGCSAFGIEREARCWALGCAGLEEFRQRCRLWGLRMREDGEEGEKGYVGNVVLRKGDFLKADFVTGWFKEADVVLVNNLKLEPETDLRLAGMLGNPEEGVRRGTRVVSTKPLVMGGRRSGMGNGRGGVGKRKRGDEEEEGEGKRRKKDIKNASGRMLKMLLTPPPEEKEKLDVAGAEKRGGKDVLVERSGEDNVWTWKQYVYEAGSVSWSNKPGLYYISVRK